MTDATPPLDRAALLGAFGTHGVRFVLVGGLAAQAHGAARATQDADICPEWTIDNLSRLAAALTDLGTRLKIGEGSLETLALDIDARTIHGLEIGAWRTSAGDVDVLLGIPGASQSELAGYEQPARTAIVLQIESLRILVASARRHHPLQGDRRRPKDLEALRELRALRSGPAPARALPVESSSPRPR